MEPCVKLYLSCAIVGESNAITIVRTDSEYLANSVEHAESNKLFRLMKHWFLQL